MTTTCRACASSNVPIVLDLGAVPAADHFPLSSTDPSSDPRHPLAMRLCQGCGLAQIDIDDTGPEQPLGNEPAALREQAEQAVRLAQEKGWLRGTTVREFPSPHGGSWIPLLRHTHTPIAAGQADLLVDSFGVMHEPDQRAAFALRKDALAAGGAMLLQFHSLEAILREDQWNALRHGHAAYYSLTALRNILEHQGLIIRDALEFPLYGGTVLALVGHSGSGASSEAVAAILAREAALGVTTADGLSRLQHEADSHSDRLRQYLEERRSNKARIFAYGAASRVVAVLARARVDSGHLLGVADSAAAKQGRRMPGTDIPIISPEQLVEAQPDEVLLAFTDLGPEVSRAHPPLAGRLRTGLL